MEKCNKSCSSYQSVEPVPYIAHEADLARTERMAKDTAKKLWKIIIFLIAVICLCVSGLIGMFIYETQYVDEEWTSEANAEDGGNAIANMNGEVNYYGEGEGNTP